MFRVYEKIEKGEPYFIAEMSANHGGSLQVALQIVREAAKAGADCFKMQTYTADSLTVNCDKQDFLVKGGLWDGYKLYDLYKEAETPYEWHKVLMEECAKYGIDFLSTPFDKDAVDFLDSIGVEAYKIASFELVDIPLIEYAASKQKIMIMSCGMASCDEIECAVDACKKMGNDRIILLKCCSEYPAVWEDMKLGNIPDMKKRFGVPVGLSDHSPGSLAAVVAVAIGADVIEKHVKISGVDSVDSEFSMTIQEYGQMVKDVIAAKKMCKGPDYSLTKGELKSSIFRRSLYAVRDIREGEVFTEQNIKSIRPNKGIKPMYLDQLLGKNSKREILYGEPITEADL